MVIFVPMVKKVKKSDTEIMKDAKAFLRGKERIGLTKGKFTTILTKSVKRKPTKK